MGWSECAGFDLGRVNSLPSGCYRAVLCICAEHSVDNTKIFLLLLSRAYTEFSAFCAFCAFCASHKMGGDTARTDDPK